MDEDEGTLPHAQGAVKARKRPIWVRNQLIINAYDMSTLCSGGQFTLRRHEHIQTARQGQSMGDGKKRGQATFLASYLLT
jgi:hypothetical protein